MPSVIDYEKVKTTFPDIFEYVSGKKGVVTMTYGGKVLIYGGAATVVAGIVVLYMFALTR